MDVCGDPSFAPSLCDKVKEILSACKGVLLVRGGTVDIGDYTRRFGSFFRVFFGYPIQRLDQIRGLDILMEVEVREAVVLREVVCYGSLSRTNSCELFSWSKIYQR